MLSITIRSIVVLFCLLLLEQSKAQLPDHLEAICKLTGINIDFSALGEPIVKETESSFYKPDACWELKGQKIKVCVEVLEEKNEESFFPNINNGIRIGHIAANEENSIISLHKLGDIELEQSGAEWGTQTFLKPKELFSKNEFCQMISLYKAGQGQSFIYILFDDPNHELLDRFLSFIRFTNSR